MPIYEYRCKSCGKIFELFQKMSDKPVGKCPKCGDKAKRLISQTSFTLKGEGWYKDGYAPKKDSSKSENKKCEAKSCEGCPKKTEKSSDA